MHRLAATALFLTLAAAAPASAQLEGRPALDLSETGKTTGTGADTAFARSVATRYAGGISADSIRADLAAQGFDCAADGTYCTRAVMVGPCADGWTVDIGEDGALGSTLQRVCMGAAADDE
jgi:hypothetical protein